MIANVENTVVRIEPIFVGVEDAASMLGISATTFKTLDRNGQLGPMPVYISTCRRRLYSVCELRRWAEVGCPIREKWQTMKDENIFENIKRKSLTCAK
ncbi:MAG TPA: hypothetical protein VMW24_27655 [Sedimentisphaerales bacterium]|nr:hypothetical protein [Sedimentisphaerales bacterium]